MPVPKSTDMMSVTRKAIELAETKGPEMFATVLENNQAAAFSTHALEVMQQMYIGALASGIEIGARLDAAIFDEVAPESSDSYRCLFIGGPWHREIREVPLHVESVECEPGEYREYYLGFEGGCMEAVYVWSGMHLNEALQMVTQAVKYWGPLPERESSIELLTTQGRTRLRVGDGVSEISIELDKDQVWELIEGLTAAFNEMVEI